MADRLALYGGKQAVSPIPTFNSIDESDAEAVNSFMKLVVEGKLPLSGFLGGNLHGGQYVQLLENRWCTAFGCSHAISVNSATSGLLAACAAVGVTKGDWVMTTPYTMSATAAVAAFLGAGLYFGDIRADDYCLDPEQDIPPEVKVVIVTNLFGCPARLRRWKQICDERGIWLIEDNAQAIYATEFDKTAGLVGDIGVFSLNVHKHVSCGEGGICVTANADLANKMRLFRNHGEMAGGSVGLNLRMTEVCAAIAVSQLTKATSVVASRIALATKLTDALWDFRNKVSVPVVRRECRHVYYMYPLQIHEKRDWVVKALAAEGVPIRAGFTTPLHRMPAFKRWARPLPVVEEVEDKKIAAIEMCAIQPTDDHINQIKAAFNKVLSDEEGRK